MAHDERIGRQVALKIMPAYLAADDERLRRFQREVSRRIGADDPNANLLPFTRLVRTMTSVLLQPNSSIPTLRELIDLNQPSLDAGREEVAGKLQFLAETLLIMLLGGAAGVVFSYGIAAAVGTLPLMGPLFENILARLISICRFRWQRSCFYAGVAGGGSCGRTGAGAARLEVGPGRSAALRVKRLSS